MLDGGGPGTIDAGTGLLGNVVAVLAKRQRGPANREVRLSAIGGGHVRVLLPQGVGLGYRVSSQRPAWFDAVFGEQKTAPPADRQSGDW